MDSCDVEYVDVFKARLAKAAAAGWGTPSLSDCDAWRHWQHSGAAKPAQRKHRARKPTLASVAKQAIKAGIEVARYEVEPDGKIVVVPGNKPAPEQADDLDNWIAKHAH
jgi:hypothetical protein